MTNKIAAQIAMIALWTALLALLARPAGLTDHHLFAIAALLGLSGLLLQASGWVSQRYGLEWRSPVVRRGGMGE